jgi:tRNA modification GTPase
VKAILREWSYLSKSRCMGKDDTVCAVSTPVGEGGIGVIRITGQDAYSILRKIFKPKTDRKTFQSHRLYLGHIKNPGSDTAIDEVLAVYMKGPNTYTREDVVEVYSHGGYAAQKSILAVMLDQGARLADPGEFTKRAFLSGRIDLLQAESVLDIIQSETETELQNALRHLEGTLSQELSKVKELIKEALIEIEALIDFPDDDVEVDQKNLRSRLEVISRDIKVFADSYYEGRAVKQGLEILIVGKPNVGKSSLLNALLLKEKAIVTSIPGTTRDMIEDTIHIKNIKTRIVDTAGLRKSADIIEQEGVERVKRKIPEVDLILWVLDGSEAYTREDDDILEAIQERPKVAVINKGDLPQKLERNRLESENLRCTEISALKQVGIEALKDIVYEKLMGRGLKRDAILITNVRQRGALKKTVASLDRASLCMNNGEPLEFAAFELQTALSGLGEITGETCPDEILQGIFDRFCIGK